MDRQLISMPSAWGRNVEHKVYSNSSASSLVVLFPGLHYSCHHPLLYYAGASATQHGHDLMELEYGFQSARDNSKLEEEDIHILVYECKRAIDQLKSKYSQLIFVGKSLGTVVAGLVNEVNREKASGMLLLTPVSKTMPYIRSSGCTVIYGTDDPSVSVEERKEIASLPHVKAYPLEGADHALEQGSVETSIGLLNRVTGLYGSFFKSYQGV